jgi:hypothetical protein
VPPQRSRGDDPGDAQTGADGRAGPPLQGRRSPSCGLIEMRRPGENTGCTPWKPTARHMYAGFICKIKMKCRFESNPEKGE